MAFYQVIDQETRSCTIPPHLLPLLGNGQCNVQLSTIDCAFDEGDCKKIDQFPNCNVNEPSRVGDGLCDEIDGYNTAECGWDGGDCVLYNSLPNCIVSNPQRIGNGICNDNDRLNIEECAWDGGDCDILNSLTTSLSNCPAELAREIGDGYCDMEFNTTECGFDGGDCITQSIFFKNGLRTEAPTSFLKETQLYATIQTATSLASLLSSIVIVWILYGSFEALSVPFNRFVFGLSIADIMSSSAQSFTTLPVPSNLNYLIWNARGSEWSCEVQGRLIFIGSIAAILYAGSLCIFCLLTSTPIKGNNNNENTNGMLEKFLHAVPILTSLTGGMLLSSVNAFQPNLTHCYVAPDPERCQGDDCDKTFSDSQMMLYIVSFGPHFLVLIVVLMTMPLMIRIPQPEERSLQNVDESGVPKPERTNSGNSDNNNCIDAQTEPPDNAADSTIDMSIEEGVDTTKDPIVSSKDVGSDSPTNLKRRALAYFLAYFFAYLCNIVISVMTLVVGIENVGPELNIVARIFFPLHGFFNFLVFIYQRWVDGKRRRVVNEGEDDKAFQPRRGLDSTMEEKRKDETDAFRSEKLSSTICSSMFFFLITIIWEAIWFLLCCVWLYTHTYDDSGKGQYELVGACALCSLCGKALLATYLLASCSLSCFGCGETACARFLLELASGALLISSLGFVIFGDAYVFTIGTIDAGMMHLLLRRTWDRFNHEPVEMVEIMDDDSSIEL